MSDPNTLRILEIDGGGERGYLSTNFLEKFIQLWGIEQNELWKYFDVICGTSVGGLMASAFAIGLGTTDIKPFFTVHGPYLFTLGTLTGLPPVPPIPPIPSIRPSLAFKLALMIANTPFYSSSGYYIDQYGSGLLVKTVQNLFTTNTLQNLKTNVVIPAFQFDTSTYVIFSNLYYPDYIGQELLLSDVALATSAAPAYLPKWSFGGHDYVDGGVYLNNPAEFGLTAGKMIKPNANRYCILSIGTGEGEKGFDPGGVPPPAELIAQVAARLSVGGPLDTLKEVWDYGSVGRTGCQEAFAKNLYLESTYTLDQLYYYRFQPKLDKETYDTELDNTDPAVLTYYENLATSVFNTDIENIRTFLGHLTA
jgi:patatin-like phospholipase/acyl hydrolase